MGAHVTGQVPDDGVVGEHRAGAAADVFPGEQHRAKREGGGIGVCADGVTKGGNCLIVRAQGQLAARDAPDP
jgi:hypothetical protein